MTRDEVEHVVPDTKTGGKYRLRAKRKLTQDEIEEFLRFYWERGGKRPRQGQVLFINYVAG